MGHFMEGQAEQKSLKWQNYRRTVLIYLTCMAVFIYMFTYGVSFINTLGKKHLSAANSEKRQVQSARPLKNYLIVQKSHKGTGPQSGQKSGLTADQSPSLISSAQKIATLSVVSQSADVFFNNTVYANEANTGMDLQRNILKQKEEADMAADLKADDTDIAEALKPQAQGAQDTTMKDTQDIAERLKNIYKPDGRKIAYLTFDDGPTPDITPKILEILKNNQINATFFVIGSLAEKNPDLIKKHIEEGHMIGNHTYSHKYKKIYADVSSFMKEVRQADSVLKNILGESFQTRLFRFPGGSFEKSKVLFREEIIKQGYGYVDWNCLNGDAEGKKTDASRLIQRVKETSRGKDHLVVLMHDSAGKHSTVEALPEIIRYLKEQGYVFGTLD
ncbi:polysaccharide deacetylase family protein [Petroclostridium sp. X23]|uniref:polysaccharide deacetylase family protein n=1 Tax=Petroclostridium sp. X23 TaxID=3045146 RepID=UPI0024ACF10C|nr:polysaccharide deacetylase family protein [Petroclostridium sp. X23]WHH58625.1 polysaccharide deacetylase family protein [Petroclostridium sp. X23]